MSSDNARTRGRVLSYGTCNEAEVGLGLNNAKAVFGAALDAILGKSSEFVRTPKYGVTGQQRKRWRRGGVFTPGRLLLPLLEVAIGGYMLLCIAVSLCWNVGQLSVPFLLIFAGGYFYVGFSTLHAMYKMHRGARAAVRVVLAEAAVT